MFDQTLTLNNESQFSVPESNNSSREQTKRIKHCSVTPGNKRDVYMFLRRFDESKTSYTITGKQGGQTNPICL